MVVSRGRSCSGAAWRSRQNSGSAYAEATGVLCYHSTRKSLGRTLLGSRVVQGPEVRSSLRLLKRREKTVPKKAISLKVEFALSLAAMGE
ncbi:MAG: hypothetical protein ACI9G1_003718 [Pirellulaceae bacterium]|jgi:hypothetical protein